MLINCFYRYDHGIKALLPYTVEGQVSQDDERYLYYMLDMNQLLLSHLYKCNYNQRFVDQKYQSNSANKTSC